MEECDTLLAIGTSFPYLEFYPKPGQVKTVQIDIDPTRIGLRHAVEVGLIGNCATVLRALLPLIDKKQDQRFLGKSTAQHEALERDFSTSEARCADLPMKP